MKLIYILIITLALAACEDREVTRTRNEQKLPPGCKIIDLDYGDLTSAVVCDGRKSTSSVRSWDETIMIYQNGQMTPLITHHVNITAQIDG